MLQPPTQGGTPAARAGATPANPARPGQVPRGERALPRLCFLSVPAPARPDGQLDRDASDAEQRRLADLGFGIALGLEASARTPANRARFAESVRRIGELGLAHGFVAGAAGDQGGAGSIAGQIEEVAAEAHAIEEAGGVPVLLPLASLSRRRAKEEEYVEVYRMLLARVGGPVIVDWTGSRLRPELLDYFPGKSFERVMALDPAKVRGARFALLDLAKEVRVRRELRTRDQLLFTADRARLASLLLGSNPGFVPAHAPAPERFTELAGLPAPLGDFSHAILGELGGHAPALAAALERLAADDVPGYLERMGELP